MPWSIPTEPQRFAAAVAAFRRLVPMTDEEFDRLSDDAKRQAFTIAGVAQLALVSDVHRAITQAIERGEDIDEFRRRWLPIFKAAWRGTPSATKAGHRLDTIFRTNVLRSYNHGRWQQQENPALKAARPFRQYDAVRDQRTSDVCEDLDGTILSVDDSFWSTHLPPVHPRCRSGIRSIRRSTAERRGVTEQRPDVKIPKGFGLKPDPANEYRPDLSNYPQELVATYQGKQQRMRESA